MSDRFPSPAICPESKYCLNQIAEIKTTTGQPVVSLHVREASGSESSEGASEAELESGKTPELVASRLPSVNAGSLAGKRSYKNPNLNISIPPLAVGKPISGGLSPSEAAHDPTTPLYQIVHTPTTAPGAPGPGDPAQIRRLEQSWAANMSAFDQISPAFPNFQPPTFADFPLKHPYDRPLPQPLHKLPAKNPDDSSALREMFALTADAKTPTFPPPSLALDFGKGDCPKFQ